MITILIILFGISLVYTATANRLSGYINVLIAQGLMLFILVLLELNHITPLLFVFILFETLIFKAVLVPVFLNWIVRRSKMSQAVSSQTSNFYNLLFTTSIIVASFILSHALHDEHLNIIYFTASVAAIFVGIYLIVTRKRLIKHIIAYNIIENGIFLMALAVGNEMPIIVNSAILLDILTSVLILGLFLNKITTMFHDFESDSISKLKD